MAFIFSTDKSYLDFIAKPKTKRRKQTCFAAFMRSAENAESNYSTGIVRLSGDISVKSGMLRKAIVGYDKELNEIIIIPTLSGNINVTKTDSTRTNYGNLALRKFLLSQGFTRNNLPKGRFKADVDSEGNVHIYLNIPLLGTNRKFKDGTTDEDNK